MSAGISPPFRAALTGSAFALAATGWCAWATGPGLGLFLAATLLAALYVPALTLAEEPPARAITPAATASGIAICWGISTLWSDVSLFELFRCTLVLVSLTLALGGAASGLARAGLTPSLSAGLVAAAGTLWLTWPVWLSHALNQAAVDWLSPAHPLLALNGVLRHLGAWDRAPLAYQKLTILNQDIPYHLPRSIIPATLVHAAIAAWGFWIARRPVPQTDASTRASSNPPSPRPR